MARFSFVVFYALTALVTGTVAGLSRSGTDAAMSALLVAVLGAAAWFGPRARVGRGFEPALLAWLALVFLSAVFAPCPLRTLHLAAQFAAAAAFLYLVLSGPRDFFIRAMVVVATIAALFGLGAYLLGYAPRVAAPFGHHHYVAGFFLLHLPLTARLAAGVAEVRSRRLWQGAAAVQGLALLGTRSFAGIVVLLVLGLWTLRGYRRWVLVAALILPALSPRARSLFLHGEDPSLSLENRLRYLRTAGAMLATRPVAGWGLGSVPLVSARYRPQTPDVMPQGEALPHLHNLPANLAAETGLLGLALAAWLLWCVRSPAVLAYAVFALFAYQLDLPALLFPLAATAAVSLPALSPTPVSPVSRALQIGFLLAAVAAPFQSRCGWDDFERGRYVEAAARLPDLIPVSAAAGASLVDAGRPREAIPYLERAAALDSYFTLAWFHLGRARAMTGDREGAVEAFSRAVLVQPVTVFAEGWDPALYPEALRRALRKLEAMTAGLAFDERTRHRYNELHAFLAANASRPVGSYRRVYSEITDADLAHNTGLLVFRRVGAPTYTSGVVVLLPRPDFYIPPGIGYLKGLPAVRAFDLQPAAYGLQPSPTVPP